MQTTGNRENLSSSPTNGRSDHHLHRFVTELHHNDILMGRGAPIINYEGNVRFRELVRTRKAEYVHTTRHQVKDEIARGILQEIKHRGGHFLRRIDSETEMRQLGISEGTKAWVIVDNDVAIEKVKQALRDKDPEKRNEDDPVLSSISYQSLPDFFPNEGRSFSAPYLSNDIGWIGGQRSHLHELLRSQSVPANLSTNFQSDLSNQHPIATGIPGLGNQIHLNQSFAVNSPSEISPGTKYRTSDYLMEFLRKNQKFPCPLSASTKKEVVKHTGMQSWYQQYPAFGSRPSHFDQVNRLSNTLTNQNHLLPRGDVFFESTDRFLPSRLLPSIANPMESTQIGASRNTQIALLHALLEEQEIIHQRQVLFGTTTHPSDFAPHTATFHLSGSREHDPGASKSFFLLSRNMVDESISSNTVARMPPGRDKVETDQMDAKRSAQSSSSFRTSDVRKRKAEETESLTALISAENGERAKKFVDKERNKYN